VPSINVNGRDRECDLDDDELDTPLLWVLREHLKDEKLTGAKFGCGMAHCGACSVEVDGVIVRSCVTPVKNVMGKTITTIEGIGNGEELDPVQEAWIKHQVPQCGYCQSGQIMAVRALLRTRGEEWSSVSGTAREDLMEKDIQAALGGNLCRCGTYPRIKKAIRDLASQL